MRGKRTFEALSALAQESGAPAAQQPVAEGPASRTRGRSNELIRLRNERLCARLYWIKRTTRIDYTAVLEQLQREFDLSTTTIPQIIQEDVWQAELKRLRTEQPGVSYFKNKWPWMKW